MKQATKALTPSVQNISGCCAISSCSCWKYSPITACGMIYSRNSMMRMATQATEQTMISKSWNMATRMLKNPATQPLAFTLFL